MAVRRCKKEDLRRIAKATGATMVSSLSDLNGDEKFEAASLGHAEEVSQEKISDDECILVKGTKVHTSASIILRGSNEYQLDEMERSVHDSLSAVKRTLESGSIVPGGGAVETALHIYLEEFAGTVVSGTDLTHHPHVYLVPGLPRTAGYRRVRSIPPGHTQNTSCERRKGFLGTSRSASFKACAVTANPKRGSEGRREDSHEEEGLQELWPGPVER